VRVRVTVRVRARGRIGGVRQEVGWRAEEVAGSRCGGPRREESVEKGRGGTREEAGGRREERGGRRQEVGLKREEAGKWVEKGERAVIGRKD
jgi:hypothetical protein